MSSEELRRAYTAFFKQSEAGKQFMQTIDTMISSQHEKGEKEPDHARDYSQRAKGIREILSKIQSVTADQRAPRQS